MPVGAHCWERPVIWFFRPLQAPDLANCPVIHPHPLLSPTFTSSSLRSHLNSKRKKETAKLTFGGIRELVPWPLINLAETPRNAPQVRAFLTWTSCVHFIKSIPPHPDALFPGCREAVAAPATWPRAPGSPPHCTLLHSASPVAAPCVPTPGSLAHWFQPIQWWCKLLPPVLALIPLKYPHCKEPAC